MLSVNKLEKVIELEEQLRTEYQGQMDALRAEIDRHVAEATELQATVEEHKTTIATQLETISELSNKAGVNTRLEQVNRELGNRSDKQQEEISELKKRVKSLQRDLAEVRAENKTLTQYDPVRMKKNLAANKKAMAEKTRANDTLQKNLNKQKAENASLERKVKELEAKLEEQEAPAADTEEAAA